MGYFLFYFIILPVSPMAASEKGSPHSPATHLSRARSTLSRPLLLSPFAPSRSAPEMDVL